VLNVSRRPARPAERSARHTLYDLSLDLAHVESIEPALGGWFDAHPDHEVETLILNAAVLKLGWLTDVSMAEVDHAFRVNVYAPLAMTRALLATGRFSSREARVVYVVSSLARPEPTLSFAGIGLYSVTKAALSRLALIQRRELELTAPHIKVLRVHPGIVDTDIQHELRRDSRLDPAFVAKTAGLPAFREGEWNDRSPKDHMRTISAELSAEFILWVTRSAPAIADEYDFYHAEEFHAARRAGRVRGDER
jgi:NAD(P)-dependent dehydrogenase (short-subunit alcohol dehydrogenase family)